MKINFFSRNFENINRSAKNTKIECMNPKFIDSFFANQTHYSGQSLLENLCMRRFPDSTYHSIDLSDIPSNIWKRADFPLDKLFGNEIDDSIKNWLPKGTEPKITDSSVQNRLNSVLGKYSIIVAPELEDKIKENPNLAYKMMEKINILFKKNGHPVPGRINGGVISFDKNGNIARYNLISGGGRISVPTKSEIEVINKEQKEKQKRKNERIKEHERIANEKAIRDKIKN